MSTERWETARHGILARLGTEHYVFPEGTRLTPFFSVVAQLQAGVEVVIEPDHAVHAVDPELLFGLVAGVWAWFRPEVFAQ